LELSAYTRTVKDILSLKRTYVIPRFQREYSWGEDELTVLWNDIISNLKLKDSGDLIDSEYFIGSLVLVGEDSKDSEFLVVDGQQRLTTITIFFAALVETFKEIGNQSLALGSQNYIESKNDDNEQFLILVNENPKPFFQFRIQQLEKDPRYKPGTDEEKAMMYAYNFFREKLVESSLLKEINKKYKLQLGNQDYTNMLKILRNQVSSFKTIYITVKEEDDAYLIFETLNAKGKDLESIDLIKNQIFKKIRNTASGDFPKESWSETRRLLIRREDKISMSQFYRHYWLSKYSFTRDAGLYDDFKKKIKYDEKEYKKFLDEMNEAAKGYVKIASPQANDWKQVEDKFIFDAITGLKIFDVTQPRPLLLALLEKREKNSIKFADLKRVIVAMEKFHFIFTAIVSSRASNIESKYSTFARQIRGAKNKPDITKVITEIINYYKSNLPDYNTFEAKFLKLYYTKTHTTDKKLIQYILRNLEHSFHQTEELVTNTISIEHIMSESEGNENIGYIGNLLPLDKNLNSNIGNVSFSKKIELYKQSNLSFVKAFIEANSEKSEWGIKDIQNRGKEMAKLAYNKVWNL
jgi:uncharacterized protein with ParB-like and HNH nuclease domain